MSNLRPFRFFPRLLLILLTVLIAACGKNNSSKPSTPPQTPATVSILLGAPQIKYAGVYAAISQGYFDDENLTADLQFTISAASTDQGVDFAAAILPGEPIFGVLPAEMLLQMRQAGSDIVAVVTLIQRDSRGIVSTTAHPINTPADLVGKRLLLVPGTSDIISVFLKTVGLDPNDVTFVNAGENGVDWLVTQILTNAVDGFVYSIEGAAQLNELGFQTTRLAFYDYGVLSYANVFFTSRQMIEQHPDVVQRFVNAVVRGMQYSIEQPEEVAAWFVENYGDQLHPLQVSVQDEAMLAIIPLMQTATSKPGMMDAETWDYLTNTMRELGLLDATFNPAEAYTLQFLNAYYAQN